MDTVKWISHAEAGLANQWTYYKEPFNFPPPPQPIPPAKTASREEHKKYADIDNEYFKRFNTRRVMGEIVLLHKKLELYGVKTVFNPLKYYNYFNVLNYIKTIRAKPNPALLNKLLTEQINRVYTFKELDNIILISLEHSKI